MKVIIDWFGTIRDRCVSRPWKTMKADKPELYFDIILSRILLLIVGCNNWWVLTFMILYHHQAIYRLDF